MSSDNKRKVLSLAQRMDVLRRLDSGQSCRMIVKEVGCGKTQISWISLERIRFVGVGDGRAARLEVRQETKDRV